MKMMGKYKGHVLAFAGGLAAAMLGSAMTVHALGATKDTDSNTGHSEHGARCVKIAGAGSVVATSSGTGIKNVSTTDTVTVMCPLNDAVDTITPGVNTVGVDVNDQNNNATFSQFLVKSCYIMKALGASGCSTEQNTPATGTGFYGINAAIGASMDSSTDVARYVSVVIPPLDAGTPSVLRDYGWL